MPDIELDLAYQGLAPIPELPAALDQAPGKGRWPRQLNLDDDTENRLVMYLQDEIFRSREERQPLIDDWIEWQKDYWAKPAQKVKNFPFQKAANVVIPMTAIAVETIHARMMNVLFSTEPFWSVRPRNENWISAAPVVEEWLQTEAEDVNKLDVYRFAQESLLEVIKLGTGIGKSGYIRDIRKTVVPIDGDLEEERWVTVRNSASLDYVPLANFMLRLHEKDPQSAAWCGEEHTFTWTQLKRMSGSGQYKAKQIEKIKDFWVQKNGGAHSGGADKYHERVDEIANQEPAWNATFDIQEIWMSFDVDGDGRDEEIVVDFHYDSLSIVAIRYNWYDDLHRPYRMGVYIPVEGRPYGIGVGKQNEQFQKLITTIHRQRLDAGTLANMGQLAIKKTSGYGPGEPIFPGKMWFLDSTDDIKEFQLSDTHHVHQINNEETAASYSERRTGANDPILGFPQPGTPEPATTHVANLTQSSNRFDAVLKNIRRWYGFLGQDCLSNYQQFGDEQHHWLVLGEDGAWVEQILSLPPSLVRDGAVVEVTVTDSDTNRLQDRQQWMSLFAVLTQYYDKVFQSAALMAQATGDPTPMMQVAQMSLSAGDHAMRRLLETFNVKDIDALLLTSTKEMPGGSEQPTNGDAPGPSRTPEAAGIEQLMALLRTRNGGAVPGNGGGF